MAARVLVIEDDPGLRALLGTALEGRFQVDMYGSAESALGALSELDPDVVLTDVNLGGTDGIEVCARLHELRPNVPVLVMTAFGSVESAVAALRAGAFDFLTKPLDLQVLLLSLERAVEHHELREEVHRLRRRVRQTEGFDEIVGESVAMRRLYRLVDRVAGAPSSVLVTGESGTGKELVARALHNRSPRRDGPFVAINCAAMPESLLESELFGHVRGAFTDARSARSGLVVQADGGTLFLDEIGDMPPGVQAKMLRVLQERMVRPVGGEREVKVDVRLVAATHQDLEKLVQQGRFREDLLYRLDVVRLELPALRDRGSDVLLLAQRFVEQHSARLDKPVTGIEPAAARKLLEYDWPGNVRELQNCIERAVLLAEFDQISVDDLPTKVRRYEPPAHVVEAVSAALAAPSDVLEPLEDVERRHIVRVLEAVEGNKATAARILGIDRKTLYRRLERWSLATDDAD